MKQSRLQAFFIWSFSLEISSFPGWKSHQTTETKSSPTKNKKTRKRKTGNFVSNWNWIFLFSFLIPHLPSVASHLIRQRMEGTAQTCQRHPGEPPSIPTAEPTGISLYTVVASNCTTVVRHVFHLRQLLLLLLLAFFLRVYKRELGELSEKIQKHRGDRWMDGWLAGRAKYLASQCLKDGRLTTPSSTCELQGRATITCRVPSVCFPCYFLLLASLALPWWSIARKQVTVTIITTARMRWERPTSTAGRQQ